MKKVLFLSSIAATMCATVNGSQFETINKIQVADFTLSDKSTIIGMIQKSSDNNTIFAKTIESNELDYANVNDATIALILHDKDINQITMQHKLSTSDESTALADSKKILFELQQNGSYIVSAEKFDKTDIITAILKSDGTHMQMQTLAGEHFNLKDPLGKSFSLSISTTSFNPLNLAASSTEQTDKVATA